MRPLTRRRRALMAMGGLDVAAMAISYTGNYTDEIKTMGDGRYRLLTLIGSGTLTLEAEVKCDVWMIGGGASGYRARGGAGGFSKFVRNISITELSTIIGAERGITSFESADGVVSDATSEYGGNYRDGGTGGGASGNAPDTVGTGDGLSKYPFEDSTMSIVGGGGGGGAYKKQYSTAQNGGSGGSNGSDGLPASGTGGIGGAGGAGGGGKGGDCTQDNLATNAAERVGSNGTLYGAGGGAGSESALYNGASNTGTNGSGYQGVCYIRIPLDQAA